MTTDNLKKALTVLQGVDARDADRATKYLHPGKFVQHDPLVGNGSEGMRAYIGQLPREAHLRVVRAFEDGPYVFTQADGQIADRNTFFDVFRFEDGLIVEHRGFSAPAGPPNKSGHTQVDGPTQAQHLEDTEQNKAFMRRYYETFHLASDHRDSKQYFKGDLCVRHEPGVRDGVAEFLRDVAMLMLDRTIDEIRLLLGQGDFVFIAAKGTHEGAPCLYIDLYRVEDEKIVEHWGFPQMVPPREDRKNQNDVL